VALELTRIDDRLAAELLTAGNGPIQCRHFEGKIRSKSNPHHNGAALLGVFWGPEPSDLLKQALNSARRTIQGIGLDRQTGQRISTRVDFFADPLKKKGL
jgi:hypothetical protein